MSAPAPDGLAILPTAKYAASHLDAPGRGTKIPLPRAVLFRAWISRGAFRQSALHRRLPQNRRKLTPSERSAA